MKIIPGSAGKALNNDPTMESLPVSSLLSKRRMLFALAGLFGAASGLMLYRRGVLTAQNEASDLSHMQSGADALLALRMPTLSGKLVALSDWLGGVIVVNFWATWCGPCLRELPEFNSLHNSPVVPSLHVIGVAIDSEDNLKETLSRVVVQYPVLIAGDNVMPVLSALGNPSGLLPFTLVINSRGILVERILGETSSVSLKEAILRSERVHTYGSSTVSEI